jgi:hypothetical protein
MLAVLVVRLGPQPPHQPSRSGPAARASHLAWQDS